ncbi:MAG: hypothetical protein M3179_08045 [Actinomycetota bacterium]|nr:hypothetical protein [Actinomycetota bacterium]
MKQTVLTLIADVDTHQVDAVRDAIGVIHDDPGGNSLLPFSQFETLHFASLVLVEGPLVDSPQLIFEGNVDGTTEEWLTTLATNGAAGLDALFGTSPGYPAGNDATARRIWLASHVVRPAAYHIGATGRSRQRIRREAELHQAIEDFIDEEDRAGRLDGASPASVRAKVQAFVRAAPGLAWAQVPAGPRETRLERARYVATAVAAGLVALVLSPLLVLVLVVVAPVLLLKELTDPVQKGPASPAHVNAVEEDEDQRRVAQNHLASVIPVKPGILRVVLLRAVLFVINQVARVSATKGELGGIPSIHFAHWSVINDGRHLLFLSNFDGSWESYLGDFIDKAAKGLTAVWSNTVNFPRTTLLVFRGAEDGPRFRQWGRASQCRTGAWYNAYPTATMSVIDNNSALREGLFANLDEKDTAAWLARL